MTPGEGTYYRITPRGRQVRKGVAAEKQRLLEYRLSDEKDPHVPAKGGRMKLSLSTGVASYSVNRRRPELALRMALGQSAGGVVRLVPAGSADLIALAQ